MITIVITLYLQTACGRSPAVKTELNNSPRASIVETIEKADSLFAKRDNLSDLREAINILSPLRSAGRRDFEVEWRFAKYNWFFGQRIEDSEERQSIFENGKNAGQSASRIEPNKPDGHFWYAANLGELSKLNPVTVGLQSIDEIREAMNKVIELQPDYQGASAYDALGQIELSRFTGGKPEKAVAYLEKGLEIDKNNSNIRLHLAQAYLATDKDKSAKQQLEYILKMRPDPAYSYEHTITLEEAKKLLATRF